MRTEDGGTAIESGAAWRRPCSAGFDTTRVEPVYRPALASRAMTDEQAFYVPEGDGPDGERYTATAWTTGPWDPGAQHAGPPTALAGEVIERRHPRDDARVVRVTAEILGPVPVGRLTVTTAVTRPGRRIELLTASLSAGGREALRASVWRIRTLDPGDTGAPEAVPDLPAPPGPDEARPDPFTQAQTGPSYLTGMEWRYLHGGFDQPGPAAAWLRMRHPLVAGRPATPLVRVLIAADSGNGISGTLPFGRWLYVNPDLTVYLHRHPVGEWVCLDATTTVDPAGIGLATSLLADTTGTIGRGTQSLYLAPR